MSRRHRAERRPGEFMADRSGNGRRRRSGLPLAWLVLLTLVALAGPAPSAAGPYREYEIRFSGEASPLGKSPSDADLINAVAWMMSNKLDLPFPVGTKAYIYVNQATFVDGLIQIAGEERQQAWDKGRFAAGVAARAGILLRGDHLARMHLLARAGLFAHELAHVSQRKLADGGKAGAAMWILEGHADWVKFQVLELLGLRQYRESRDEVVRSVITSKMPVKFFPDLQVLTTSAGWVRSMNQLGAPATYGQAFLAVDWLIERYGSAKLLEFLGRFALQAEPREHWRTVFSIADRQFGDEFRSRLEGLR